MDIGRLVRVVRVGLASAASARPKPWTVTYGIGGFLCVFVVYNAIIGVLRGVLELNVPPGPSALVIDTTLLAMLGTLSHVDHFGAGALGIRCPRRAGALSLTVRILIMLVVADGLWSAVLGGREAFNPFRGLAGSGFVVILLTGLAAAITAPVAEELFFRGLLYRCLRARLSPLRASVVNGILFALAHTRYATMALPPVALFGAAACLLYEQTGSILPGMAMHSAINASGFELALTGKLIIVPFVVLVGLIAWGLSSRLGVWSGATDGGKSSRQRKCAGNARTTGEVD